MTDLANRNHAAFLAEDIDAVLNSGAQVARGPSSQIRITGLAWADR
jgi:hypothetical protein